MPIRQDLAEVYGENVSDLWKSKRWVHLLALIDGLPSNSRFIQTMYDDEEFMEMVESQQGEGSKDSAPPLSTWSPEMAILADIYDMLAIQQQTAVGAAGGKTKKPKPYRRPLTSGSKPADITPEQQTLIDLFGSIPTQED